MQSWPVASQEPLADCIGRILSKKVCLSYIENLATKCGNIRKADGIDIQSAGQWHRRSKVLISMHP